MYIAIPQAGLHLAFCVYNGIRISKSREMYYETERMRDRKDKGKI